MVVISILGLLLGACTGSEGEGGDPPSDLVDARGGGEPGTVMDPCGTPDHPCTLGEVSPEARAATRSVADEIVDRLAGAETFAEIVGWLRDRDDVAHVAVGPEGLRFRVPGGRGHWVLLRTAGTVAALSAPTPLPSASHRTSAAPVQQSSQGTTGGRRKRALLVSPFQWQWQVEQRVASELARGGRGPRWAPDGIGEVAAALRARDYADVTIMAESLHPTDPERTVGMVGLDAFTTWDDYDYVHLLTHGAAVCEGEDDDRVCMPSLLAPWTEDFILERAAAAEEQGDEGLAELLDLLGVETSTTLFGAPTFELPGNRTGGFLVDAAPDQIPEIRMGTIEARPASSDAGTPRSLVGDFLILSPAFFDDAYPDGVSDAIIVLSACSSGYTGSLAGVIAGPNSVVLGWKETATLGAAAAAGTLLAKALVEVDEEAEDDSGLTVQQSVERIREWLDDVQADPPSRSQCQDPVDREIVARCQIHDYGRVLTVFNEVPADPMTGSTLVMLGDSTLRAREVVYLVDGRGRELRDSATLRIVGTEEDAARPAAEVRLRVDGLGLEEDPRSVALRLGYQGAEVVVPSPLEEEVAPGVWEVDAGLPLAAGTEPGDRIDIEAIASLPDGGETRWEYRDLLLAPCAWSASVSGGPEPGGDVEAFWGTARFDTGMWPPLDIDADVLAGDPQPESPWLHLTLTNRGTVPRAGDWDGWREVHLAIPGVEPGTTGSWSRVWGTLTAGLEGYAGNAEYLRRDVVGLPEGTGIGYLLTTDVSLTHHDDVRVAGTFDARFLDPSRIEPGEEHPLGVGIHDFPDATIRMSGDFDILLDRSCTTGSGLL